LPLSKKFLRGFVKFLAYTHDVSYLIRWLADKTYRKSVFAVLMHTE
jgi:hypothetical protein